MTTRWLAVVALVGCGAKPAEPLENPTPLSPPVASRPAPDAGLAVTPPATPAAGTSAWHPPLELSFPRPTIETPLDPPDVTEIGRWPLTVAEHRALEPHFAIAAALADPGITWTELCARGAHHRHLATDQELVVYLDAWCSVVADDYAAAIVKLGNVRHATNRQLASALTLDVAAIVAAHGPAHDLESFLRAGGFLDATRVDAASAAYFEIGKLDDALEANELAQDMDAAPSETTRCTRMLRAIADTTNAQRDDQIGRLRMVAHPPADGIRTSHCRYQYSVVQCWKDSTCDDYWSALVPGADVRAIEILASVYRRWRQFGTGNEWLGAADEVLFARPLHDRDVLLVPALGLALRLSLCDHERLRKIAFMARLAIDDLTAPAVPENGSPDEKDAALDHRSELTARTTQDIANTRAQLEAIRTAASRVVSLDTSACRAELAKLPALKP